MEIKDYLNSLSKDELISLLMQLSEEEIVVKESLESMLPLTSSFDNNNSGNSDFNLSSDNENLVSRVSSPQEKINLFKSLFVGRQDVFALRWQNSKSGKSGYSPVCENKWVSGKCDMKKYSCSTCLSSSLSSTLMVPLLISDIMRSALSQAIFQRRLK